MNTTPISKIETEIRSIQAELQTLGPMHPGSISKQYQVCGRTGCKCMAAEQPQRHGPYNKLAYVYRGKKACRFVRAGTEKDLAQRLASYKRFRQLTDQWVELSIQRGIIDFFPSARSATKKKATPRRKTKAGPRS